MTTDTATAYKFKDLSKEAKQHAISHFSDINVDHDWWKWTYEDATTIGLLIEGFELPYEIDTKLEDGVYQICQAIKANHGEECDTYKLAMEYMPQFAVARLKGWDPESRSQWAISDFLFSDQPEDEREEYYDEWESEFRKKLETLYLKHLQDEYEYQTSDEAIIEAIECNGYEFDEEGDQI